MLEGDLSSQQAHSMVPIKAMIRRSHGNENASSQVSPLWSQGGERA
jgi:hypothetical protein